MENILHYFMACLLGTFIAAFWRADAYGDRMESRFIDMRHQAIERGLPCTALRTASLPGSVSREQEGRRVMGTQASDVL